MIISMFLMLCYSNGELASWFENFSHQAEIFDLGSRLKGDEDIKQRVIYNELSARHPDGGFTTLMMVTRPGKNVSGIWHCEPNGEIKLLVTREETFKVPVPEMRQPGQKKWDGDDAELNRLKENCPFLLAKKELFKKPEAMAWSTDGNKLLVLDLKRTLILDFKNKTHKVVDLSEYGMGVGEQYFRVLRSPLPGEKLLFVNLENLYQIDWDGEVTPLFSWTGFKKEVSPMGDKVKMKKKLSAIGKVAVQGDGSYIQLVNQVVDRKGNKLLAMSEDHLSSYCAKTSQIAFAWTEKKKVILYDLKQGKVVRQFATKLYPVDLMLSEDGNYIYTIQGNDKGIPKVFSCYDLKEGKRRNQEFIPAKLLFSVEDKIFVATRGPNSQLKVLAPNGDSYQRDYSLSLAVYRDGRLLYADWLPHIANSLKLLPSKKDDLFHHNQMNQLHRQGF